jgi:hypothetical protein
VQFCRTCGANLKVIGKAVSLSEAIARSDRGPLPKIKELVKNFKVEQVTDEVSAALEKMNAEIVRLSDDKSHPKREPRTWRRKKTPAERREQEITKGVVGFFSGIGSMVFLYYLSAAIVLKVPPDVIAKIPFELEPVVRMIWLIGMVPLMSGLGHIISGLLIRVPPPELEPAAVKPVQMASSASEQPELPRAATNPIPRSVTEHTTELLSSNSLREH